MAVLVTLKGPNPGQRYSLDAARTLIGRQPDCGIYLDALAVSRQHAVVSRTSEGFVVEDLGSSNGTYVNGRRVTTHEPLTDRDTLQIGPYLLALHLDPEPDTAETQQIIRHRVEVLPSNQTLYAQNAGQKLQVVLEIAQQLGPTLDLDPLLGKLLDHLLRLFPQADRGMVLLGDRDRLVVHAQRSRRDQEGDYPYSRTIVRRALEEGVGILSEDVGGDPKLQLSATLLSLQLRSFLCVPLIGWENKRLGIIQLDCLRHGAVFHREDLDLLTTIALQVAVVVENAGLHGERLRQERLRQEIALARDIQQSFLPKDFQPLPGADYELFARVHPAREVSGDLYDFFPIEGKLAFFLGDVSGKGMPAALFMIAVRTLSRLLTASTASPAEMLRRLNAALVADNPTALFVTLIHGVYDPASGEVVMASGAHPPPLLRRPDGTVEPVKVRPGIMLGYTADALGASDARLTLGRGETLILYTDGFTEAFAPDGTTMFGMERLGEALGGPRTALSLQDCAEAASAAVQQFSTRPELQDDQTLLLLRRGDAACPRDSATPTAKVPLIPPAPR